MDDLMAKECSRSETMEGDRTTELYSLIIPDISPVVKIHTNITENERKTLNLKVDFFTLTVLWGKFEVLGSCFKVRLK